MVFHYHKSLKRPARADFAQQGRPVCSEVRHGGMGPYFATQICAQMRVLQQRQPIIIGRKVFC